MRGDFSRFSSSDSFKHYIAALMQQGRVQLDSDWNQNVEYYLNMLWKQSRDSFGTYACIGDSFRVGKDIPIDHMLQSGTWKPEGELSNSQAYIFLNATERPRPSADSINEKGSLFVQNAGGISREFNNLDLSRFRSLYVRFKAIGRPFQLCQATFNCPKCSQPYKKGENQYCTNCRAELKQEYFRNENSSNKDIQTLTLRLYSQREEEGKSEENNKQLRYYQYEGQFVEDVDAGGFCKVRFDLLQPVYRQNTDNLAEYDISHISKLSVLWTETDNAANTAAVCIGLITAEPMALVVSADADMRISGSWANVRNTKNDQSNTNNNSYGSTNTTTTASQKYSTSVRYNGKPTIIKQKGVEEISWSFSQPKNFNSITLLKFAERKDLNDSNSNDNKNNYNANSSQENSSRTLYLTGSNNQNIEYSLSTDNKQDNSPWRSYVVNVNKPSKPSFNGEFSENDLKETLQEIKAIGLKDFPDGDSLYFSEILGELNFENNFLISSDMNLNQSARMYINGLLCSLEHWDTYLTQKYAPADNAGYRLLSSPAIPGEENKALVYGVYAVGMNRSVTYLEDPEIREVALGGGADTATRLQTICQIKLIKLGDYSQNESQREPGNSTSLQKKIDILEREIKKINDEKSGRLTIIGQSNSSSLLSSGGSNYSRPGNFSYLVQVHDGGEIKAADYGNNNNNDYRAERSTTNSNNNNRFTIKWSKNNASVAFPMKQLKKGEQAAVLEPGGRSLVGVFRVGDLIEIIDDKDELSEHPKGHMRRISHIDMDNRILSWGSAPNSKQTETIGYLHDRIDTEAGRYQPELHAKVILWDGIKYGNSEGEAEVRDEVEDPPNHLIALEGTIGVNGPIRIKFDPGIFRSGDYWTFTTRSNGSIELLTSAKPMGPKRDYALLALMKKETGKEIEIVEDLRHTFQPLTDLRAIDITYEDGGRTSSGSLTVQAAIQRLSAGRVHFLPGHRNKKTIKDVLIEAGEIYQLKQVQGNQRSFTSRVSFNDVYEHQPFLIYTIMSNNRVDVGHEIHWFAADEEGNITKDPVDDGTKNYAWKGFQIKADENAQISWLAVGDSYTYFERYVKRTLDEVFKVIFGVDTDQLKEDTRILDAWHKNLEKWTGPDLGLAGQARERLESLQHDWDRFVRNVDKQVEDFETDVEEFFSVEQQGEGETKEVSCTKCGESFPKGEYSFCTNCGTKLPE